MTNSKCLKEIKKRFNSTYHLSPPQIRRDMEWLIRKLEKFYVDDEGE